MGKRTACIALLVALAFVFSYIEFLLPLPFGVPGMKLGLANLVVVIALYTVGAPAAAGISLVRVLLGGFTFGTPYGMLYSLTGAALSYLAMLSCYRSRHFSVIGVSMLGGILHNVGQLLVAFVFLGVGGLLYYLPLLLLSGALTGMLIGTAAKLMLPKVQKIWRIS